MHTDAHYWKESQKTCNYLFITKGKKGVYQVKIIVDKYLDSMYEDVIDHIIYSFDIIDKITNDEFKM